jgi:hypothetical protein
MAETKKLKKIKPDPFTFREALVHPFIPLLDKFAPQMQLFSLNMIGSLDQAGQ